MAVLRAFIAGLRNTGTMTEKELQILNNKLRDPLTKLEPMEISDAGPGLKHVTFRFTKEEMASLERTATSLGMDVMELIHNCLKKENLEKAIRTLEDRLEQSRHDFH